MLEVALCLVALIIVWISHWVYTWANPKCNGKLPPGSMGLPFIGESMEFFSPHATYDVLPFIKKRTKRYGAVFRTGLVGRKVVVSTDAEINYKIFQQDKSFIIWYSEIAGKQRVVAHPGVIHKYLKNLILRLVGVDNIKGKLLPEMHEITCNLLSSWAKQGTADVKETTSEMIFAYFAKKMINYDETKTPRKLKHNYEAFTENLISFPLNIPGTSYHSCMQGYKNAMKVIKDIFKDRKASNTRYDDFLDHLLDEVEKKDSELNESVAIDLVFLLFFATHETTSPAMTFALKFISDHPQVLAELTKEHEEIIRNREAGACGITWEEYKSMTFTHMVINETVRLANIVPGIFRKVVKDVEIKGYTIPAGWVVMVVPSALHLDPEKYEDPLAFNPWRWEGKDLHVGSKSFMAFGGGARLCVGADFAKLELAIFLHYLVTKYRWSVVKGGDIIRTPGVVFTDGLHIEISEKENR